MKMPRVIRPEIEIEYKGVIGFLCALFCICWFGIRVMTVDVTFLGEKVGQYRLIVIPKYSIVKGGGTIS